MRDLIVQGKYRVLQLQFMVVTPPCTDPANNGGHRRLPAKLLQRNNRAKASKGDEKPPPPPPRPPKPKPLPGVN